MFTALRDTLVLLLLVAGGGDYFSSAQSITDSTGSIIISSTGTGAPLAPGTAGPATTTYVTTTRIASPSGTCPNRPVNHLTHTLPLQCLRKDRFAPSGTQWPSPTDKPEDRSVEGAAVPAASTPGQHGTSVGIGADTTATETNSSLSSYPTRETVDTTGSTSVTTAATDAEGPDVESPLDNANFLSFEEWKKQNLAKAGQSPDVVGQGHNQAVDEVRPRPGITNALDALGEENEIDLDFGFGRPSSTTDEAIYASTMPVPGSEGATSGSRLHRSKDAGKTCKERTNYASFDCAANVLKSNSECKSASSVLVEHKDSYMLNICSAQNKFFIVELCDDIQIDTIVLANYEFFSSVFRQFRVSVSDRYPVKLDKWKVLGTFEARNTREIQAFLIENPMIWAKYLRIEILSHYGNEYYCPVSLLRVHGTTMMQDYRQEEELARGETVEDVTETEVEINESVDVSLNIQGDTKPVDVHPVTEDNANALSEPTGESIPVEPAKPTTTSTTEPTTKYATDPALEPTMDPAARPTEKPAASNTTNPTTQPAEKPTTMTDAMTVPDVFTNLSSQLMPILVDTPSSPVQNTCSETYPPSVRIAPPEKSDIPAPSPGSVLPNATQITDTSGIVMDSNATTGYESTDSMANAATTNRAQEVPPTPADANLPHSASDSSVDKLMASLASSQNASATETGATKPPSVQHSSNSSTKAASSTAPQPPQPSTQESFFKSITKRLQQLESNSTLSLQYIEEQSRILRDAFTKVEKRQNTHALNFLSHLNSTVMNELQGFRQAYDQLWQSTVIELENHREAHQREMVVLSRRLSIVADELLWQKRMGIVQSSLLLLCLGLVLFARPGSGSQELPLVQQVMNRSQAALRAGWDSDPGSPSRSRGTPSSLLRHGLWRKGYDAADSRPESREGPDVRVEPPTPPTKHLGSGEDTNDEEEANERHAETQSSPATPTGAHSRRIGLLDT